jgi:outer membrane protein assembly factor BamB
VLIVALQWLGWFGTPLVVEGLAAGYTQVAFRLAGGLFVLVWWACFSRAPGLDRWLAPLLMVAGLVATPRILHPSIADGMMGMTYPIHAVPVLSLAFVVWAVAAQRLSDAARRATMAVTILLATAGWALLRNDGITGRGVADFAWRWASTAEERMLNRAAAESMAIPAVVEEADPGAEWSGFRGPRRDSVLPGVRIETDWSASPPMELWRRPVGPGWSSFAVHGGLLYTQEQHGEEEVVSCYDAATGEPVWRHRDTTRFWDPEGSTGPRATPTFQGGRLYTLGATGILNVLDATDGSVVWSRNAAADTGVEVPHYGFASSPLVLDDLVIVHTGPLAAFDAATGDLRWSTPVDGLSYSSPHLLTIDGIPQVLLLSGVGITSVVPTDGASLWEHAWPGDVRCVQPARTADGDLLLGSGLMSGLGMRRIAVSHGPGGWSTKERWTSNRLSPTFNDFVVHDGHAYGIDGGFLACIELRDGQRRWKRGRYGHGQLLLLPDQGLLLVLSEKGDVALVAADPDRFTEVARLPAIEGKTWNHPVLAGDLLLVRNDREMAAFRLALAVEGRSAR